MDRKEESSKSENTSRNSREILCLVKLTKSTPVCDFGRLLVKETFLTRDDVDDVAAKDRTKARPRNLGGENWQSKSVACSLLIGRQKLLNRFIMQRSKPHAKTVVEPCLH